MKYTYEAKEYLRVWNEYLELNNITFSPNEPKDKVISKLEEISYKKRELADIANCIVKERIEYFEKNQNEVTEEVKEKIYQKFGLEKTF